MNEEAGFADEVVVVFGEWLSLCKTQEYVIDAAIRLLQNLKLKIFAIERKA